MGDGVILSVERDIIMNINQSMSNQKGMALFMTVFILMLVTWSALVLISQSDNQTKIVGNIQHNLNMFNAGFNEINFINNHLATNSFKKAVFPLVSEDDEIKKEVVSPYASYNDFSDITKPELGSVSTTFEVEHTLKLSEDSSQGSQFSLTDGYSIGSMRQYKIIENVEVRDGQDNTNKQEVGIILSAPALIQI